MIATSAMPTIAPRFLRPVAAVAAALLAFASTGFLYVLAGIPEVETFAHVRFVLGPDGIMRGSTATTLAWLAAPIAAAACAWALAVRAARRERWTGAWMGLATYGLAVVLAAFVPGIASAIDAPASLGENLLEGIMGSVLLAMIAAAALGPLLVSCIVAGSVWAWIVRSIAHLPAEVRTRARPFDYAGITVLIVVLLTLLGSLVLTFLFNLSVGLPDGMD